MSVDNVQSTASKRKLNISDERHQAPRRVDHRGLSDAIHKLGRGGKFALLLGAIERAAGGSWTPMRYVDLMRESQIHSSRTISLLLPVALRSGLVERRKTRCGMEYRISPVFYEKTD